MFKVSKYLSLVSRMNIFKTGVKQFARLTGGNKPDINNQNVQKPQDHVEIITETTRTKKLKKQTAKTINIESSSTVTEDIKIQPYFSNAVSEKEKSHTNISVSSLIEVKKSKSKQDKEERKKQQEKKKAVMIENIKRELPKEL
jgi:hypothetical protein